jgi:hypothetical protein
MLEGRCQVADKFPVTTGDLATQDFQGGIKRPKVTTGKADPIRARIAKRATGSAGSMYRQRQGGMMIDFVQNSQPFNSGFRLDAYRTSYANGLDQRSGTYDVPTYFQQMNEQNGGLLYWPVTLQEKYQWYRYWARTDAYIGRSLELLSDLPMSKLTLSLPKHVPKKMQEEIMDFYTAQMEKINAFQLLLDILWEVNMIGNVYIFHEWDEKLKMWSNATVLPPEEVYIFEYPFSQNARVEYRPERLMSIIEQHTNIDGSLGGADDIGVPGAGDCLRGNLTNEILAHIPKDIVEMVKKESCIVMDTDPTTGSFVHHVARRKSPYLDLGASVLERVLVPMLQKEHYRYTQLSLASRNMTPKNLIYAEGLMPEELDDLRTQVDLSYMDPEYTIITNYAVTWEQIGAQDRLIDLSREYEVIDNQIFAGLGVTRELLTGDGAFSGNKITVEIMNTMFLLSRETLKDYLEKQLFKASAEAKGWYTEDKNGIKKYWYPNIGFNRLTIRDNAEVFDSLFQLYQKGSLPVEVIYELFNLDADRMEEALKKDLFKVNDATFNRMVEEVNSEVGRAIVERSDIIPRQIKYLGLKEQEPPQEDDGFGGGFGGGFGSDTGFGSGESAEPAEESVEETAEPVEDSSDELSQVVEEVSEQVSPDATEDEVRELIEEKI